MSRKASLLPIQYHRYVAAASIVKDCRTAWRTALHVHGPMLTRKVLEKIILNEVIREKLQRTSSCLRTYMQPRDSAQSDAGAFLANKMPADCLCFFLF